MSSSECRAQCPICSGHFPMQTINRHVDACLLTAGDADGGRNPPAKSETTATAASPPVRKRPRLSPDERETEPGRLSGPTAAGPPPESAGQAEERSTDDEPEVGPDPRAGKSEQRHARPTGAQRGTLFRYGLGGTSSKPGSSTPTPSKKKAARPTPKEPTPSSVTPSKSQTPSAADPPSGPAKADFRPLAERLRPTDFEAFVGQEEALGRRSILRKLLDGDTVPSMIFWGPPGCGKTTLANIIAQKAKQSGKARFVALSATLATVATVKEAVAAAANEQRLTGRRTILFVDEIHRFNKLQQDTFLPHIEKGTITFVGATTENPSFKVNGALLSRCRVVVLQKLGVAEVVAILRRAARELGVAVAVETDGPEEEPNGEDGIEDKSKAVCIEGTALTYLANLCDGDARSALNALQMVVESQRPSRRSGAPKAGHTRVASDLGAQYASEKESAAVNGTPTRSVISTDHVKQALQRTHVMYDREGDEHYNCISALHKSMRGSNWNAALYWLARMLIGGEDPLYIARRLIAFASEDVGLADPQALIQAVSTHQACQFLGVPACEVVLAQCVIYLCKAPKSSLVESSLMEVKRFIQEYQGPQPAVPLNLRPGSTQLMRDLGHGKGYVHSAAAGDQGFLPDCLGRVDFFKDADLVL